MSLLLFIFQHPGIRLMMGIPIMSPVGTDETARKIFPRFSRLAPMEGGLQAAGIKRSDPVKDQTELLTNQRILLKIKAPRHRGWQIQDKHNNDYKSMKLIKLASFALAVAGIVGVCNVGAATDSIGVTTDSTTLNVAIIVMTNAPSKTSNSNSTSITYSRTIKSFKITNKQLLTIFQNWASASCSSIAFDGTKIVIGWDEPWNGDVLVVDKTGTNVLFDASTGATPCGGGGGDGESVGGGEAYFYVDFDDLDGAQTRKFVDASPGSDTYTEFYGSDYELYDDDVFLPYTDLIGNGGTKATFAQKWDMNRVYSTWNLSATGTFPLQGNAYFYDSDEGSVKASIKTKGSGNGNNRYWYGVD
jgi:hypothetical protein